MDPFSRDDLRALLANRQVPCISLLLPTTRGAAFEDKIRWKNLIREAEERLTANGQRSSRVEELLQPARGLLEDVPFWLNVSAGLAVFLSPEVFRTYRLPLRLKEQVVVADHFHITPLLPLLVEDGRFYVLTLSQKNVRLLQGTRHTVEEIALQGLPANMSEALHYGNDPELRVRTAHTHTAPGGPAGRREAIIHGQGPGVESAKDGLLEYLQQVDRGLHRYLRDEHAPLVLAADGYLLPIYRLANTYAHLVEEGVEGHPDRLSAQELRDRAWAVVQPHFQKARERVTAQYRQLAGTGRTSNDVAAIVTAAYQGHIQYLFVTLGRQQWGTFDPADLKAEVHANAQPGDEELLNLAAIHTLAHKGTVYAVDADKVPDGGSSLAAIYWLPLGERSSKRTL